MKSDIIKIDNQGNGFTEAIQETQKTAEYQGLEKKEIICLKMVAEEMLSLARSVTGEMQANFWLESEGKAFELFMTTKTVMDKDKRYQLISSTTSRQNEIRKSFLGKLRDSFEQAMAADGDRLYYELPNNLSDDVSGAYVEDPEWDGYERSVLRGLADDIKIAIKGSEVKMTVSKRFS